MVFFLYFKFNDTYTLSVIGRIWKLHTLACLFTPNTSLAYIFREAFNDARCNCISVSPVFCMCVSSLVCVRFRCLFLFLFCSDTDNTQLDDECAYYAWNYDNLLLEAPPLKHQHSWNGNVSFLKLRWAFSKIRKWHSTLLLLAFDEKWWILENVFGI